jgi:Ca-activated chloride channel family protein
LIIFENPKMLFFLLLIPFIIILHFIAVMNFKRRSFKFANFETIKRLTEAKHFFSKKPLHLLMRILFLVTLCFAMAGTGFTYKTQGIQDEIIFAVDASGSMLATDLTPTRLGAVKTTLSNFIGNLTFATNLGLISFTYFGFIELDATEDKQAVMDAVDALEVRKGSGTSLGSAIGTAAALFETEGDRSIVLFTDGQENFLSTDELMDIIDHIRRNQIDLYIVGVGSEAGAPISNLTTGTSVVNEEIIIAITERSGGEFKLAENDDELRGALDEFFDMTELESTFYLSEWLYLLAFIFLIFEWFFANYIGRSFPN